MTVFLGRLTFCREFWDKEVVNRRPNMLRYFERMKERNSFKSITIMPIHRVSTFTASLVFLLVSTILASIIFGISYIFTKPDWKILPAIAGGLFFSIVTGFAILGCRMRS